MKFFLISWPQVKGDVTRVKLFLFISYVEKKVHIIIIIIWKII